MRFDESFSAYLTHVSVSLTQAPPTSGPVYEVYANVEAAKFGHLSKVQEYKMCV